MTFISREKKGKKNQDNRGKSFRAGQVTGKETARDMEHLLKLLHKEWERSGRTKAQVSLKFKDMNEVGSRIAGEIQGRQVQLDMKEMTFKQSMALSKENFILLRLARKIKSAADKAGRKETDVSFAVEMDKEEYRLFCMLVKVQEV